MAKRNKIEGQSCLTSKLSTMEPKRKRCEFLPRNRKGKADKFCYKRKKRKGRETLPQKTKLRKEKAEEV